jgi:hypothetical protein
MNVNSNKIALNEKYKADFEKVRGFINEFDPCGFIDLGAPVDEYDCLTNVLLSACYNCKTRTEIKSLFIQEIESHFETPDLRVMDEVNKNDFYNDLEKLIDKLEVQIETKPNR